MLGFDRILDAPLRTLDPTLRLRRLLDPRPPTSSSASKENIRKCLVHLRPEESLGFLRRRLAYMHNANKSATPTTATGTAMAAFSAGEHDKPLQLSSIVVGASAPLVLAALDPLLVETEKVVGMVELNNESDIDVEALESVGCVVVSTNADVINGAADGVSSVSV
jgi:hypothetical protein